jgi:hypothetical protein
VNTEKIFPLTDVQIESVLIEIMAFPFCGAFLVHRFCAQNLLRRTCFDSQYTAGGRPAATFGAPLPGRRHNYFHFLIKFWKIKLNLFLPSSFSLYKVTTPLLSRAHENVRYHTIARSFPLNGSMISKLPPVILINLLAR